MSLEKQNEKRSVETYQRSVETYPWPLPHNGATVFGLRAEVDGRDAGWKSFVFVQEAISHEIVTQLLKLPSGRC